MSNSSVLLVGDFYLSLSDLTSVLAELTEIGSEYLCLANFEMSPVNDLVASKAVPILAEDGVLEKLSELKSLKFSIVNNHILDGTRDLNKIKEKLALGNFVHQPKNLTARVKLGSLEFVFFGDEFEDVTFDTPFHRMRLGEIENVDVEGAICVIHGGLEYRAYPTVRQRIFAEALVDRGAEAVAFHHSHVEGIHTTYRNKVIHYGLGNFMFSAVSGLHGLSIDEFAAIEIDGGGVIRPGVMRNLVFEETAPVDLPVCLSVYADFYKRRYPLDASFRPRQTFVNEGINVGLFRCWAAVARPLVRMGLSKMVKRGLKFAVRKN